MSWRNTDRAFGSRARGLRGVGSGLGGFVAPGTVPTMRWRNTDRSWGNRPRGLPFSGPVPAGGLGQVLDAGGFPIDSSGGAGEPGGPVDTGSNPFGGPAYQISDVFGTPPAVSSNLPQTLTQIGQAGFQDAFKILQLLNPVPPGTVMQTGPAGTFISRAGSGQATALPSPFGTATSGGGTGLLLLVGVGVAILFLSKSDR